MPTIAIYPMARETIETEAMSRQPNRRRLLL